MADYKIRKARRTYTCHDNTWAHNVSIRPGDDTLVITYFTTDWEVRQGEIEPLERRRLCNQCLENYKETGFV